MSLETQLTDYGRLQEELFGPIAVDEITNPLADHRQERTPSARTLVTPQTTLRNRYAGPVWAVAAFVAVLAVAAIYLAFSNTDSQVADTQPPPTTVVPEVETLTDLEVIQAGVTALYSGDAERAIELFDLGDFSDDQLRRKAAYEAAIGARLTLNCTERETSGAFTCTMPYRNALTDAMNTPDETHVSRVLVEDGVIREFSFPDQRSYMASIGDFFLDIDPDCAHEFFSLFPDDPLLSPTAACVNVIIDHLDEWAAFERSR